MSTSPFATADTNGYFSRMLRQYRNTSPAAYRQESLG